MTLKQQIDAELVGLPDDERKIGFSFMVAGVGLALRKFGRIETGEDLKQLADEAEELQRAMEQLTKTEGGN